MRRLTSAVKPVFRGWRHLSFFGIRHSSLSLRSTVAIQNPGILAAAALRRINYERAFSQCDAGQAARHNYWFLAVENERTEVNVPAVKAFAVNIGWMLGQFDHRLRDVVPRVGLDSPPKFVDFSLGRH